MTEPSTVNRIDHVAIRVRSLSEARSRFVDGLGFVETSQDIAPDGAPVMYIQLGHWEFEVFEDPDGEPGLDHIALGVPDLDAASRELGDRSIGFVGNGLSGTRRSRALIVDTSTSAGIRMHLCERPPEDVAIIP